MNFFAHQDQARSNTRKLVFLFICAVITLIVITSLLVIGVLTYIESQNEVSINADVLGSKIFFQVSLVVICVIGLGTLIRLGQLRGGGKVVAEAMGGRLLNTNTRDADERKILNVVEEMAIASGTSVPPVYLMEDESINAFAAGYRPRDAVIGITRGCIRELTRDELQGVVAHEFSHIFNGDMRLNIRLMGLLYGIMVIGLIGYHILRGSRYRSAGSRSGKGNGAGAILMLGLGLMVIGYSGTFFGNLIKAGVSRQREFLADASAVQYTRNSEGIGGALKKIDGYIYGTEISSRDASEISHMLFCSGLKNSFSGLFATHPPLQERIKRIDARWAGMKDVKPQPAGDTLSSAEGVSHFSGTGSQAASTVLDSVGNPTAAHLAMAATTLNAFSPALRDEAHNTIGASLMIYNLLLALSDKDTEAKQLATLKADLAEKDFLALQQIEGETRDLPREKYLALIDLAMPSLKQLSRVQYREFMAVLGKLMMADEEISLFEWCLFKILRYTLDERVDRRMKSRAITSLAKESEVLLSVLASAGNENVTQAQAAFHGAEKYLGLTQDLSFQAHIGSNTGILEDAVDRLNSLKPLQKTMLLKAMVTCINTDGKVTAEENELLRAVGSLLDCPIPPLLDGQRYL
ncbi:M48 family metallopeptidase [Gammaproteobacteria bacterium]|nr:M48 family metallopeptidase [Gammaproteobacteria bacterium]